MTLRLLLPLLLCTLLAACSAPSGPAMTTRPDHPGEAPLPPVVQDSNPTDGRCGHCGVVEHIERSAGPASAKDGDEAVLGGIVGGVLENDKQAKPAAASGFTITVRLDGGQVVTIRQRALGGVRQGQRVEIVGGRAQPLLQ
jgi:hypothetical protein